MKSARLPSVGSLQVTERADYVIVSAHVRSIAVLYSLDLLTCYISFLAGDLVTFFIIR